MPNIARSGICVLMLQGWAAGGFAEEPDPAALVRQVRGQESWVERVESLQLKASIQWERTPLGLEQRRRELRTQFPDADLSKFRDLQAHTSQIVELAFDKKRIRLRIEDVGDSEDLRIWDGKRFILHNRYDLAPDRSGYLINREPEKWLYWLVWNNFQSFRAAAHEFWWMNLKRLADWKALEGNPEDFAYEGTAEFHGTKCHVVSRWESWKTFALAALHKKRAKDIIIIGVHPPGSELSAIEKMMKEFELAYPICIDVAAPGGANAWGSLFQAYGVDRIPHSIVIDKQGRIAATGSLGEVLPRAAELAGRGL